MILGWDEADTSVEWGTGSIVNSSPLKEQSQV